MRPAVSILALLTLAVGSVARPAAAGEELSLLVCYPGGGAVKAKQAKQAMDKMLDVLRSLGGLGDATLSHEFTSDVVTCRNLLAGRRPELVIASLGLFLEHRQSHHLVPVAQPVVEGKRTEIYRVLVKRGKYKRLADLKGKTLGGSLLAEPLFLQRVVFKAALDPKSHFQLKPSHRALRALRKLSKGQLDAVLVNDQQFRALRALPFAAQLEPIFTSDPLPQLGLAADGQRISAADRKRLTAALTKMCDQDDGREICELFGLETFVPAEPDAYEAVVQLWEAK